MRPIDRQRVLELRQDYQSFPREWQFQRRRVFLMGVILSEIVRYQRLAGHLGLYIREGNDTGIAWSRYLQDKAIKAILKAQGEIIDGRQALQGRHNDRITDEMIERAKMFPFTELYQFKRNMARCPFHDDKTPSFALMKDNRARCFGACGRSWDTIDFIMLKEGKSFPEAVRSLQ
jgi:hypothetical protein